MLYKLIQRALALMRAALLVVAGGVGPAFAGLPPWPDAPYSYFAENVPLERVLGDFAAGFSLTLSMQPGVGGAVNGRFTTRNPSEFIGRLGGVYGFTWFTHAGTLYVTKASDVMTRSIPLPAASIAQMRNALADLGVLDARFGWGELPDQGVVLVSGPPNYVSLVEATVKQLPPGASAQQVMVFRLRHASAEDRTIQYRDRTLVQPGLATVLRELIAGRAGGSGATSAASPDAGPAGRPPGQRGVGNPLPSSPQGDGGPGGSEAQAQAGASAPRASGGPPPGSRPSSSPTRQGASIQSDPRLNALIIQDVPERMPLYQQLIAQLDVPTALIEIEAMIIDINSDKAKELGINWSARVGNAAVGFGQVANNPGAGTVSLVGAHGNFSSSTLAIDAGNYLISQIRILETDGNARIQSRPSVLTTDNTGALLDMSETFYIRVQGERVANVSPVTAGTTLKVTPRLIEGDDPSIQLTIDIEDGQIQDRQVDSLPTVRRSTVSTQAIVRQNETLLIAGHASDQNIDSNQRVPVLGDLPGLGVLFSNKQKIIQKRERLFMIKPKLVSMPGTAVAVAAEPAPLVGPAPAARPAVAGAPAPSSAPSAAPAPARGTSGTVKGAVTAPFAAPPSAPAGAGNGLRAPGW